jgi:transglutaminase-like putative cysteine protease
VQKINIFHRTLYRFSKPVQLKPHKLYLRPRDGHDVRISSSILSIKPHAELNWFRDELGNSVAVATFDERSDSLQITSELLVEQYQLQSNYQRIPDLLMNKPICYSDAEKLALQPYLLFGQPDDGELQSWLAHRDNLADSRSISVLAPLCAIIGMETQYQVRDEQGVQSISETLQLGSGSCRDLAWFFMCAVRELGFAARFVSGYLINSLNHPGKGATHAWAEVYLPGAGWVGFDPTTKSMTSAKHIAVASALAPDSIPPVSGSYMAESEVTSEMEVIVKVDLAS